MNPVALRLLAALPDPGLCTMRRAALHSGLTTADARRAVLELAAADLIMATLDGRLTLDPDEHTLLELTDEGRRARAETFA